MKTNITELSHFTTALQTYLADYHPHLLSNEDFIKTRSEEAAQMYEEARQDGESIHSAMILANEVLFSGLRFSKYKTILSIMESDFLTIPENKRPSFALKMLNRCKPIFDRYQIEDDFETRSEYSLLCWELLGAIQNYIDTDGIQ